MFRAQGAGAYQVHLVGKRKSGPGTGGGLQGLTSGFLPLPLPVEPRTLPGPGRGQDASLARLQGGQTLPFAGAYQDAPKSVRTENAGIISTLLLK